MADPWPSLPRNLLPLVWAHLPLPQLLGLRHCTLHVKWIHEYMNDPSLIESCARRWESHTLCAVILKAPNSATYDVGVVHSGDSSITLAWHKIRLDRRKPVNTMCSGDGGLVCFCLTLEEEGGGLQLVLGVVNPLTGACRVLPSDHGVSPFDLKMMHLVVDKETGQYQVLLVHGEEESSFSDGSDLEMPDKASAITEAPDRLFETVGEYPEPLGGVIFDSGTGVWRNARSSSQVFLGLSIRKKRYVKGPERGWEGSRPRGASKYRINFGGDSTCPRPVAYDCATGKVITLLDLWSDLQVPHHECALSKDSLFELVDHRLSECWILVGQDHLGLMLVEDDHLSGEARAKMIGEWPASPLKVLACEGYLLVHGSLYKEFFHRSSYRIVGLLYDMRTGGWVDFLDGELHLSLDEHEPVEADDDSADTQVEGDSAEEDYDKKEVTEKEDMDSVKLSRSVAECWRQVRVYGDHPAYFESAPIMLCNLDWEAVP